MGAGRKGLLRHTREGGGEGKWGEDKQLLTRCAMTGDKNGGGEECGLVFSQVKAGPVLPDRPITLDSRRPRTQRVGGGAINESEDA